MGARVIYAARPTRQVQRLKALKAAARINPAKTHVTVVVDWDKKAVLAVGVDRQAAIEWCIAHPERSERSELIDLPIEI